MQIPRLGAGVWEKNIPQANALSIRTCMFSGVGEPRNISKKKNTSCDTGLVVVSNISYFHLLLMEMIRFDLGISFKWIQMGGSAHHLALDHWTLLPAIGPSACHSRKWHWHWQNEWKDCNFIEMFSHTVL